METTDKKEPAAEARTGQDRRSAGSPPVRSASIGACLLGDIEKVVNLANKYKLKEAFFENAKPQLQVIASLLRVSETQAALFSLILEQSGDEAVSIGNIARTMNCGKIQMLKYMDDFEALEKKRLIRADREGFFGRSRGSASLPSYLVPLDVIKALRAGRPYRNKIYRDLSPELFFDTARELLESNQERDLSEAALTAELNALFSENSKSAFVQGLKTFNIGVKAGTHFLAFCCVWLEEDAENIPITDLRPLLGVTESRHMERHLKIGDHKLIKEDILVNGNDSGLADTEIWTITQKARDIFLADIDLKDKKKQSRKNLIRAGAIQECPLFYPSGVSRRISELTSLLMEENFVPIKKRLGDQRMAAAFTILFQGPPGTGKTETAYQIARLTGRDICLVDISETKSQWFGDSEKRIKAVFDRYRSMVRGTGLTPILLFNEADAVLSKRQELGDIRRGPAQTENAIQNIILQEMENLKGGILIATTNLVFNLDKAFERRFLYKIEFEKPDPDARAEIWRNRFPDLSGDDAANLSCRFDFTGGQIENVARKQTINAILHGSSLSLDGLAALCEDELLEKAATRIGFCV